MVGIQYEQYNGVANDATPRIDREAVNSMNGQNGTQSRALDELVLDRATPAEAVNQAKLNGSSWRGALSLEAYLRREEYLATQGIAQGSGLTQWVLSTTTKKDKGRDILAGCETLQKRAIVSHNGQVQDTVAHGVGSVFTPPAFRGHGYGAVMMRKLASQLEHWQTQEMPCFFSILYSDIGKKFYAKNGGWHAYPSAHLHLRPEASCHFAMQPQAKALFDDDLPELCAADEAMIRSDMAKRQQGTAVTLIPDHATLTWHHARENFVSNELYGKKPTVKGAIAQVGDDRIWCIFSRLWYNEDPNQRDGNTMHILRLVVENRKAVSSNARLSKSHIEGIASVLQFAQHEAHEWNMGEVELWNPSEATVEAAKMLDSQVKVIERDSESITSLRWYGPAGVEVEWLNNEKYGWC